MWKYVRFAVGPDSAENGRQATQWVRELGLNPNDLHREVCITEDDQGGQLLAHFSEFVRDDAGRVTVNHVLGVAAQRPVVIPIDSVPPFALALAI